MLGNNYILGQTRRRYRHGRADLHAKLPCRKQYIEYFYYCLSL